MKRRGKITSFSRDYRKAPKFDMGLPRRRRRFWPRIPLIGWAILAVLVSVVAPVIVDAAKGPFTPTQGCRIWQITDGDTVKVYCPTQGFQRARLVGYDSPELFSPSCSSEWFRAVAATYYLRWQLWTAWNIKTFIEGRDRYDRVLLVVLMNGQRVAPRMVNAGLGRWYDGGQREGWCA